jgi:hypothetical protein
MPDSGCNATVQAADKVIWYDFTGPGKAGPFDEVTDSAAFPSIPYPPALTRTIEEGGPRFLCRNREGFVNNLVAATPPS